VDLLVLVLIVLLVLALVGGYAVSNLIWILAVVLLVVLIWRMMAGRRAL
jgi:hypothetical protein